MDFYTHINDQGEHGAYVEGREKGVFMYMRIGMHGTCKDLMNIRLSKDSKCGVAKINALGYCDDSTKTIYVFSALQCYMSLTQDERDFEARGCVMQRWYEDFKRMLGQVYIGYEVEFQVPEICIERKMDGIRSALLEVLPLPLEMIDAICAIVWNEYRWMFLQIPVLGCV